MNKFSQILLLVFLLTATTAVDPPSEKVTSGRIGEKLQLFLQDGQRRVKLADILSEAIQLLTANIANVTAAITNPLVSAIEVLEKQNLLLPSGVSKPCRNSLMLTLIKVANFSLSNVDPLADWSLALLDSQGKLPSGVLRGNAQWLGNFFQCVSMKVSPEEAQRVAVHGQWSTGEQPVAFVGQYCLLSVKLPNSTQINFPGKGMINADDIALKYGSCFPSTCSVVDIKQLIASVPLINQLDIDLEYGYCQKAEVKLDTMGMYLTALCLCPVVGVLVATLYDYIELRKRSNEGQKSSHEDPARFISRYHEGSFGRRCLLLLSWRKTFHKLFVSEVEGRAFAFIHGLRFLSILWVIVGHTVLGVLQYTFDNLMDAMDMKYDFIMQLGANAFYSVDTFLFLGGFSFTYFLLEEFRGTRVPANIFLYYVGRFTRLLPSLILVQIITAGPFMAITTGPLWPKSIELLVTSCRSRWWEDLLFINNFRDMQNVCIFGDWYLAVDSQLFLVTVPLVVLMSRKPKYGIGICLALILTSLFISVYLFAFLGLKSFQGLTSTVKEISDYANYYYQYPWTRMAVYFQAVILGYYMSREGIQNINMSKKMVSIGWIACLGLIALLIFGTQPWFQDTPMPGYLQILHGIFSKPVWGLLLVWIVVACATNNGGVINSFLSMRIFWPLGRLSYCLFLTHGMVIFYFLASVVTPTVFTVKTFFAWAVIITLVTIFVSIVIYGLVEGPVGDARKVFIKPFMDAKYASVATNANISLHRKNGTVHLLDEEELP